MSYRQEFKKKLQEALDEQHEQQVLEMDMNVRRGKRMADRTLRDLIPYYGL